MTRWAPALLDATNSTPFCTRGDALLLVVRSIHSVVSDGLPDASRWSRIAATPCRVVRNTHVRLSAGLTHTAGALNRMSPWGMLKMGPISPPTWPGAPPPLRVGPLG